MTIASLRINNFRNLAAVDLAPCLTGLNVICGNNGSGKTSLLEAIYYLGLGRSFRSSVSTRLIQHTKEKFSIFSQLVNAERHIPIGVERDANGVTRLRICEQDAAGAAELASYLPLRMINSQSHQLFESGPAYRRKFLDWGLFYQADNFLACWRYFERILKQRNALLSERRPKNELTVWTNELVKQGLELDKFRRDYVNAFIPVFQEITQVLLGITNLDITYQAGWDENLDFAAVLAERHAEEWRSGHTQFGPHRADLCMTINGMPVKHFLSRGQQKLLICAMIVAQGQLLAQCANKRLIYLVDDLPAELDLLSRQKLISLLSQQQTQIFITAIENNTIYHLISDKTNLPVKVFHVEHGSIEEITHLRQL